MKKKVHLLLICLTAITLAGLLGSCGSIRTFGGIEHEYTYDFDSHGGHHHHHKKPKKHHHKHHHHHHHHHDDD